MSRTSTKVVKPAGLRTRRVGNELHIETTRYVSGFGGYGRNDDGARVYKNANGDVMVRIGCQHHSLASWRKRGAAIFQRFIERPNYGTYQKPKSVASFLRDTPKTARAAYLDIPLTKRQRLAIAKVRQEQAAEGYNDAMARQKLVVATLNKALKIAAKRGATLPAPPRPLRAPIQPLTILAAAPSNVAQIVDTAGTN